MTRDTLFARLAELRPWLSEHGVTRLRVFGSYARDEAGDRSDVDLVADFSSTPTLLEMIGLEQELSARLGLPVDLASTNGLKPRVRARVEAEAVDA